MKLERNCASRAREEQGGELNVMEPFVGDEHDSNTLVTLDFRGNRTSYIDLDQFADFGRIGGPIGKYCNTARRPSIGYTIPIVRAIQ